LTRDTIWNAAIDLFAEKGFDDTTIDEIAEAAFVSRRSFFRYFESKNDLMAQPIVSTGDAMKKAIDSCPRAASTSELLHHVVLAVARGSAAEPRTSKVIEIAAKYPEARAALMSRMTNLQGQLEHTFRSRYKDALTVEVLSAMAISMLSITTHYWYVNGQKDIDASASKVFSVFAGAAGEAKRSSR
jgi:AcrR family transcriptional regulator